MEALIRGRRAAAIFLGIVLLGMPDARAQKAAEPTVKAAFLYKFTGYVEWPASSFAHHDTPIVIGVIGAEDVAAELERIVPGRRVNERGVAVKRLREGESPRGTHLLFVGRAEAGARAMLRLAQQLGILAVTETERGLDNGATINFVIADERVGFEVSLASAERSGLRISSRMLAVARRVVPRP